MHSFYFSFKFIKNNLIGSFVKANTNDFKNLPDSIPIIYEKCSFVPKTKQ
jgi:hypothetical protein